MKIELYQIDENSDFEGVKFASLSTLYKIDTPVDPEIYKKAYEGEVPAKSLQHIIGHKQISTTLDMYTDFRKKSLDDAAAQLEKSF